MKILIVEDEFISRALLLDMLSEYGSCHTANNGKEAIEAVKLAIKEDTLYDLICLDIMMPEMDGQQTLIKIREEETAHSIQGLDRSKVIMISALDDAQNILKAFSSGQCEGYIVKPITLEKISKKIKELNLDNQ